MMGYVAHEETRDEFTLKIVSDDLYRTWGDMTDQPFVVVSRESAYQNWHVQYDGTAWSCPAHIAEWRILFERGEYADMVERAFDVYDATSGLTDDGRVVLMVECADCEYRPRIFKSMESAAHRAFEMETGETIDNVKIHEMRDDHRSSSVAYMVWSQPELDAYAGAKNAKCGTEYFDDCYNGNVWGYSIEDQHGDCVDSCCGFCRRL